MPGLGTSVKFYEGNTLQLIKEILKLLLLLVALICLVLVTIFFYQAKPKAIQALTDIDRATIIAAGAATNIEKASREWEKASKAQSGETTKAMSNVSAAAAQFSKFVSRTDNSVNLKVLPALSTAISEQNTALLGNQTKLQSELEEIQRATVQLQRTLADADKVIADPSLIEASKNLNLASQQAVGTLQQAHASVTDVRQVADKFRETYLKPQNVAWAILKELIGLGGSMAQMIK